MDMEDYNDLAAKVLTYTKVMQPQFSNVTTAMAEGWAEKMARVPVPPEAFVEAAEQFQAETVDGSWLTIGWLIVRAKKVADGWRNHPDHCEALRAYDEARVAERDRQIAGGTFWEVRGFKRPKVVGRRGVRRPVVFEDAFRGV